MSLYDRIRSYIDAGKTDAEIAKIPYLMESPRLVPLADLNELLLSSGAWAVLLKIAASDTPYAGLAQIVVGLFQGKLTNFDAAKYRDLLENAIAIMAGNVAAEDIATIRQMCGVGQPNPTVEEIAAARAEGEWLAQRATVEAAIDTKYSALLEAYNAAKNVLGGLNVGDKIPNAEALWA